MMPQKHVLPTAASALASPAMSPEVPLVLAVPLLRRPRVKCTSRATTKAPDIRLHILLAGPLMRMGPPNSTLAYHVVVVVVVESVPLEREVVVAEGRPVAVLVAVEVGEAMAVVASLTTAPSVEVPRFSSTFLTDAYFFRKHASTLASSTVLL